MGNLMQCSLVEVSDLAEYSAACILNIDIPCWWRQ